LDENTFHLAIRKQPSSGHLESFPCWGSTRRSYFGWRRHKFRIDYVTLSSQAWWIICKMGDDDTKAKIGEFLFCCISCSRQAGSKLYIFLKLFLSI
jgi:hypothetical protein